MARTVPVAVPGIGWRVGVIRRLRGLSRDTVAGLVGISRGELAGLETARRWCECRGLVEDFATALGCSVIDLTGQPYLPMDRGSADALAGLPGIRDVIHGVMVDELPDRAARPLPELHYGVREAQEHLDQDRVGLAGRELGALLAELHIHASAKDPDIARAALPVLVRACYLAALIADRIGHADLVLAIAARGRDAATRSGDPVMLALARLGLALAWTHIGARRQAGAAIALVLAELDSLADPTAADTGPAEMVGLAHLMAAKLAAHTGRAADAHHYLAEARALAERTGERNTAGQHFGPALVTLGTLSVRVDLGEGADVAEQTPPERITLAALPSPVHTGRYHFHLARALAQTSDGARDTEAIRHLNLADQAAPVLLHNHPIAREVLASLTYRARRQARDLDRMVNRFGITRSVGTRRSGWRC
ncbi:MAG TPA: helix-turn-helix transcriptional regulator [Pseudonocardiaceae bacterium]|nr:helix-turn-helix transcriptional regulator [Pseudonocardiaceae bacterium]